MKFGKVFPGNGYCLPFWVDFKIQWEICCKCASDIVSCLMFLKFHMGNLISSTINMKLLINWNKQAIYKCWNWKTKPQPPIQQNRTIAGWKLKVFSYIRMQRTVSPENRWQKPNFEHASYSNPSSGALLSLDRTALHFPLHHPSKPHHHRHTTFTHPSKPRSRAVGRPATNVGMESCSCSSKRNRRNMVRIFYRTASDRSSPRRTQE